jgi:hypothetical protein
MQVNCGITPDDVDQQQVERLCQDLTVRLQSARAEQTLLGQLVTTTDAQPFRARRYRELLASANERYCRLYALYKRYCS